MLEVTAALAVPRLAAVEAPNGLSLGIPHDRARHTAVLQATLQALAEASQPGTIIELPFPWPEEHDHINAHPAVDPPIVKAIVRRPWFYRKLMSGDIPQ
jgi:hypothetical protein